MNTATETQSLGFTSHLIASDKREWSITVAGVSFVIARETPERVSSYAHPSTLVDCVDTWTLLVVNDAGERVEVSRESGMWMRADRTGKRPTVAQHTSIRLERIMTAARTYAEGHARLTVMLDELVSNIDDKVSAKTRKLRDAATMAVRNHQVYSRNASVLSVIAGDAVLIVASDYKGGWHELTYRAGDEAVYDSYNLSYTGEITSISPKTITVQKKHSTRTTRMTHEKFVSYNDQPIETVHARNAETSRYI